MDDVERIRAVWHQQSIPVALRREGRGEMLRVRLPYADDNWRWLRSEEVGGPNFSQIGRGAPNES